MMEERELMKSRALELAKPKQSLTAGEVRRREMLEFILAGEHYALETRFVGEAITIQELTPIPGTPSFLSGLINVRGRIIPVVNLKLFFLLREEGLATSTKALILNDETYEVAILTDAILPALWISDPSVKPVPSNLQGIGAEHLLGVTSEALLILDGESLITKIESSLTKEKRI